MTHCGRTSNGTVEAVVTEETGRRVTRDGFGGERKFFREFRHAAGPSGKGECGARGAHRLWMAPGDCVNSYVPGNGAVRIEKPADGLLATGPAESRTGIQKQIALRVAESAPCSRCRAASATPARRTAGWRRGRWP